MQTHIDRCIVDVGTTLGVRDSSGNNNNSNIEILHGSLLLLPVPVPVPTSTCVPLHDR